MSLQQKLRPIIGDWVDVGLHKEFTKDYMSALQSFIKHERSKYTVYPPSDQVFRALKLTSPHDVKVCVVAQDPYHDGNANGLAFSNDDYQNISPSLRNIFKEIERDIGFKDVAPNPDLARWAEQGVLLLNTSLTVREGEPGSHSKIKGYKLWQRFTSKILRYCSKKDEMVVFLLWGKHAQSFKTMTNPPINPFDNVRVLEASHPSPFSAHLSFNGCGHFSKTNDILKEHGLKPIEW